jgi:hypothetical protein
MLTYRIPPLQRGQGDLLPLRLNNQYSREISVSLFLYKNGRPKSYQIIFNQRYLKKQI